MFDDRTGKLEEEVRKEHSPRFYWLVRLFCFVFSSTRGISVVYLGAFLLLSVLRPVLAWIWNDYIQTVEAVSGQQDVVAAAGLLVCYFLIHFLTGLLSRYVYLLDDIEQLNLVQANRQQEQLHTILYRKLADTIPETMEIPKLNDRIDQVFRFVNGRYEMNSSVMLQGYSVVAKAVSVLSIAISLYIFNPWLCLVILLAPLPTIWVNTWGQNLMFQFRKNNTELLRRAAYFEKLMISPSAKELKVFALYDFIYGKWKKTADEYTEKEQKLISARTKFILLHHLIINFTIAAGSVLAIVLMVFGKLTLGGLGAVLSLISTLVADVKELLTGFATLLTKKNEAALFFDFMELPERKKEGEECGEITLLQAENIKYRYPLTDNYVLNGVNLTIKKGEKIAFVGENGMGKTTFVKLITGMLLPSEGKLKINGRCAEDFQPDSRFGKMGVVMQNMSKYITFTIGDNVFFGDIFRDRDEKEIDDAMRFAGLSTKDKESLLGKETGGIDLSGGEWQKLSIARVAYRDRDLILLDEPTSNLDPLAEAEIFQKYMALAKDKTVIFVTHRISVASLADRIVVFEDGKIVQDGTHEELLMAGGVYTRLYKEQAKWYDR